MGIKPSTPYGKDFGGCGLVGIIDRSGKSVSGNMIVSSLCSMKDRGNGLGSGYAVYGAYPDLKDSFGMHVMYNNIGARGPVEELLKKKLKLVHAEPVPVKKINSINNPPEFWRYFVNPVEEKEEDAIDDDIVNIVMEINERIDNAYVISSGKNLAVFKGVGHPDAIAEFFRMQDYSGYLLLGHTRFPTNTPGWWGGAHPFTILDWSIVHNGEISSYGTNKRYVEMFGYKCTLLTDTEVVAYLLDLLIRKKGLSLAAAATVLAPPFWKDIQEMNPLKKDYYTALRVSYANASLNGPFAILMGFDNGILGLNDRIKLRPLIVGRKDDIVAIASEESAIREIINDPEDVWAPKAGEPIIVTLKEDAKH
ncbi:MAG: glutamine amidotransferase family protein [Deltaproteobacteria bacterium]|nr:glutamine amidotransferase family protein [Deltaproteobacteria bacterium]MCL5792249.1 glutamine amidotransferase family protein [Deltaproteobacteria bacterium]